MNQELAIQLIQQALILTMWLCLPLLGILFIVGVVISLLQTLTSIQDPSFGAVPRLAALFVALLLISACTGVFTSEVKNPASAMPVKAISHGAGTARIHSDAISSVNAAAPSVNASTLRTTNIDTNAPTR